MLFDSHFHIIDKRYPLFENKGYLPPEFTLKNYKTATKKLDITGGAVVSGSFQKFDQRYLKDTLEQLGKNYYGVANIPFDISQSELVQLNKAGIVAVRFNLKRGGSETLNHLVSLSNRLYDNFGWHTELYIDAANLKDLKSTLIQIPSFSIDHLGLSNAGLPELFYWAERGIKIKATGFGRIDFDPVPAMKKIMEINPAALMFGTDLPSTRAKRPFSEDDIKLIKDHFTDTQCNHIFYQNAQEWYSKSTFK